MNARRVSAKLSLVVPFALALPACLGEPMDAAASPPSSSIETRQSAYISIPPPDQDDNGGGGGGSSSGGGGSAPTLGVVFENCTSDTRRSEMRAALGDILANWSTFVANLNARGLTSDHNCMLNRLTDNGKVRCEACSDPNLAGHSSLLGQTDYLFAGTGIELESAPLLTYYARDFRELQKTSDHARGCLRPLKMYFV
jgi:hypothetical protein